MYVPDHFRPTDAEIRDLLARCGAVDLVTVTAAGLLATLLPMLWEPPGSRAGVGPFGALVGHVARNNAHWKTAALGASMAIVRGPDAYITPSWYATKREHGRVVPTWNYVTIHAHGRLVIHDDLAWVEDNVRQLTARFEGDREHPWAVDDAPPAYIAGQLRAIVGVELMIDRLEAKSKLSQNRSDADIDGVIEGLEADDERAVSAAMHATRAPAD
ncbi:MAG: FMN-binding negative transcriptional regulator [Candidatus Limnocylindrales bacterium]